MTGIDPERLKDSRSELVEIIVNEIEAGGPITFARFMELAVSHPEYGYYASGELRTGFEGDFLTAPETDPIFGQTIARQIEECWKMLGEPTGFTTREDGAGRGMLAAHILSGISHRAPNLFDTMVYELSDLNQRRVEEALDFLQSNGFGKQARPRSEEPIEGVLLANELLDAFPVHRLVQQEGELREIYVAFVDGWFQDTTGPLSDEGLARLLSGVELPEGQRAEVSPAAASWAEQMGNHISRGYAILIDYGYPAHELYNQSRFDGTVRGYSRHDVTDDPYLRVGKQDLTVHVNFTAISQAAQAGGMHELGLTTQAYFLAGLGIEQLLLELQNSVGTQDYVTARHAVMHLIDPRGLGRFRVLLMGKNVDTSRPLSGLSFSL